MRSWPWMGWIPVYLFLSVIFTFFHAWLKTQPQYVVLAGCVLAIRIILALAFVYEVVRIHRKKKKPKAKKRVVKKPRH